MTNWHRQSAGGGAIWCALGVLAGMGWQLQAVELPALWTARAALAAVCAAWVVVWAARRWLARTSAYRSSGQSPTAWPWWALAALLAALLGVALGYAWAQWRAAERAQDRLPAALEGVDLQVQGWVDSLPQRHAYGERFVLRVEKVTAADGSPAPAQLPARVWVSWWGGPRGFADAARADASAPEMWTLQRPPPQMAPGDRWVFTLRVRAPRGQANPHGFDAELWLWEQDIHARATVRAGPRDAAPERLARTAAAPIDRARYAVREAIFERLAAAPGATPEAMQTAQRTAGVIAALVTGDQSAIERLDWDIFRTTGVAHLMSVSGLHITLFAWAAMALVRALWRRSMRLCAWMPASTAALWGGVALAGAYALFTGWGVPAQRTVWMLAAVCALRIGGLNWPAHVVWLGALLAVAVPDPWALLQPGFWLSFVAVGVLFAAGPATAFATKRVAASAYKTGGAGPFSLNFQRALAGWRQMASPWLGHHGAQLVAEQLRVSLALAPLTVALFQQWSLVGLLANLVAIPWVTGVVLPLALLGVVVPPLWDGAAFALALLAVPLQWAAALPGATVDWPAPPLIWVVCALAGAVWVTLRLPWAWRCWGLGLALPLVLWRPPTVAPGQFELLAADVGQGQAVLVRTAHHALLYDAGPRYSNESDAGQRVLVPLLRALGVRLDRIVLSHRDTDHTGGALAVLAHQPQALLSAALEPAHPLRAARTVLPCHAGQRWEWDGVRFEVLHPAPEDLARATATVPRANTLSCVLRVQAAANAQAEATGPTALLLGDVERDQEAWLVRQAPAALRSAWVLVPHHGSGTSSSPGFIAATGAQWAVVQAGWTNRYGHPQAAVLGRWQDAGAQVVTTGGCGAAIWQSGAPDQMRCWREERQRYWHTNLGATVSGSRSAVGR